ncbi:MAG: hypothetical protein U0324_05985 [Polyangiales bacterium]
MTASDRAFRALAQAEPDVMMAALRALVPRLAVDVSPVRPEDLSPTRLDALAPAQDVDWVARSGARSVVHLECQGYRDPRFMTRLFRYHLALALLHPRRAVHTIALWLRRPRRSQRARRITRQRITVEVEHVVLGELDARALLADPRTAWLAAGADAGDMSDEELCARVVAALVDNNASWYQRHMAAVTAQMKKRMKPFEDAMARANLRADSPPTPTSWASTTAATRARPRARRRARPRDSAQASPRARRRGSARASRRARRRPC